MVGHRIPVWYHKETGEIFCEMQDPEDKEISSGRRCLRYVVFKCSLAIFNIKDGRRYRGFKAFLSDDCLVTGYDIIFFWVARMAFMAAILPKTDHLKMF